MQRLLTYTLAILLAACGDATPRVTLDGATDTSGVQEEVGDVAPDLADDTASPEVDVDPGPSEADKAFIHGLIDELIDLRMEAPPEPTAALVDRIVGAKMTPAQVEELLRMGRKSYPSPPQRPGVIGQYVDDATKPDGYDYDPPFESDAVNCYGYDPRAGYGVPNARQASASATHNRSKRQGFRTRPRTTRLFVDRVVNHTQLLQLRLYDALLPLCANDLHARARRPAGHGGNSSMSAERSRIVAQLY